MNWLAGRRLTLWVGAGGAIGALLRYQLLIWLGSVDDAVLPWGTIVANVAGSLALGVLLGLIVAERAGDRSRLFLGVGLFGGFTTFSFFSYENFVLFENGELLRMLLNAGGQALLGLAAAALGYSIAGKPSRS